MPLVVTWRPVAKASTAIMEEISWTRSLVSRGVVLSERSWESFAWRQGCWETLMLGGRDMMMVWMT